MFTLLLLDHLSITDPSTLANIHLLGEIVKWIYCYFETPLLSSLALKVVLRVTCSSASLSRSLE